MTALSDPELDNEFTDDPSPSLPSDAGGTILDQVRQIRQEVAESTVPELTLEIPGYRGALGVRYKYPESGHKPLVAAIERAQNKKDPIAMIRSNAGLIAACCYEIMGRQDGGEWKAFEPDPDRGRLRFNHRLAELFNIEVPADVKGPATFICRHIFSPRAQSQGIYDGDPALMTQGGELLTWLQDSSQDVDEAFQGE